MKSISATSAVAVPGGVDPGSPQATAACPWGSSLSWSQDQPDLVFDRTGSRVFAERPHEDDARRHADQPHYSVHRHHSLRQSSADNSQVTASIRSRRTAMRALWQSPGSTWGRCRRRWCAWPCLAPRPAVELAGGARRFGMLRASRSVLRKAMRRTPMAARPLSNSMAQIGSGSARIRALIGRRLHLDDRPLSRPRLDDEVRCAIRGVMS